LIEFEVEKKKKFVWAGVVSSDDPGTVTVGTIFRIPRSKFEECVEKLKKQGSDNPEKDAIFKLALYGICY